MGFRQLVLDQVAAARAAAEANDLLGDAELGDWWRGRAAELETFLADLPGHVDLQARRSLPEQLDLADCTT